MSRLTNSFTWLTAIVLVALITGPLSAHADSWVGGASGRLGYDPDPDQFIIGGQLVLGQIGFTRFTPSLDIGYANQLTTYCGNFDLRLFSPKPPKSDVSFYAAAGPTVTVWDYDGPSSSTEIGASIAAGLMIPMNSSSHYVLEVRFGFGNIPDLRVIGGIGFGK